jgi:LysR family positive regulator for ilvC
MNHHELRAFLAVSSNLHFGRAGRDVNLSPSALSRTIRRLEDEVGERLFVRDTRAVELTAAGRALRSYAQELLDGWESFRASLADSRHVLRGELSVYCSVAASYTVLTGLIAAFRRRQPAVHLRIETGDPARAIERLQGGLADVAVAARPAVLPRSLVFRTIAVSPLLFAAPTIDCEAAALTSRRPIAWARVPMILTAAGLSRRRADQWFRRQGIRPNVYAEVSGHEGVISMVRLGCGVGIVPRVVLDRFAEKSEARVLAVEPALEPYVVGLCAHRRRLGAPVVKAFWECADLSSPGS